MQKNLCICKKKCNFAVDFELLKQSTIVTRDESPADYADYTDFLQ